MIDDARARVARDVGIEAVCEQQRQGGRLPSQREAEDVVAAILPRALEDAQAGLDAQATKTPTPTVAEAPKLGAGRFTDVGDLSVSADVNCATNEVTNVQRSEAMTREDLRRALEATPEMMAIRARFKLLARMPEWRERIQKSQWKPDQIRKILDDSNSVPGLGRWDDVLRGYTPRIMVGGGLK